MAVTRSSRIDVVVALARGKQDKAASALREQQQLLEQERNRLQDLQHYYQHYIDLFAANTSGLRASQMSESRNFLQQMVKAIEGQELQLQRIEQQLVVLQAQWHKCYLKVQSLEELQKRYRVEEIAVLDRAEQAEMDEWTTQRSGREM